VDHTKSLTGLSQRFHPDSHLAQPVRLSLPENESSSWHFHASKAQFPPNYIFDIPTNVTVHAKQFASSSSGSKLYSWSTRFESRSEDQISLWVFVNASR